jgi:hypothetical protein
VPIELKSLLRANFHKDGGKAGDLAEPAEIRHLQEAMVNYMTVNHVLWPFDFGPLVIMRVLVENRWGEAAGPDMRERVSLVSRFFNEVTSENSGRAVRGEPPLDYEKVRGKWCRLVETSFPQLGYIAANAVATPAVVQGPAAGKGHGKGKGGPGSDAKGGSGNARALHNGRPVCYSFNQREGCKRQRASYDACRDAAGKQYAHYCNHYDKAKKAHCLAMHARCVAH